MPQRANTYTRNNLYRNASALRSTLTRGSPQWQQITTQISSMNRNKQYATKNGKAAEIRNKYGIPNSRKKN